MANENEDEIQMRGDKVFRKCPRCLAWFQFGPHVYQGKTLPSGILVCRNCYPGR